jgi:hypothetical protein
MNHVARSHIPKRKVSPGFTERDGIEYKVSLRRREWSVVEVPNYPTPLPSMFQTF